MAGRRPIFASLISDVLSFTRDFFYKILLEPESHAKRRAKKDEKIQGESAKK